MKKVVEQAEQATNGRPAKLQLGKITEIGKSRLSKQLVSPAG